MAIDFNNNIAIYVQIVEHLKFDIISGKYKLNEKIPSVRDLASEMKVNPNTMQKALSELESLNLIYTERTNGKYITNDEKIIEKYRKEYIDEQTKTYVDNMKRLGLTKEDVKKIIGGLK